MVSIYIVCTVSLVTIHFSLSLHMTDIYLWWSSGSHRPFIKLFRACYRLIRGFWIIYTNILRDKTLFCAFEAGDIVCWLVNLPIAKLDLFSTADCRWICKTYTENCYRNSVTVCRLVQSPTLQSTISVGVPVIYMVKVYKCHPLD